MNGVKELFDIAKHLDVDEREFLVSTYMTGASPLSSL